ncbi:MAG: adenosylmethionine--8-amino-7-oxononanoate transaminase [Deltaproteobacteria bacterium]|nr:adenosylmethionine--8-amino-7-oxononanoate transaminase [Deltaproteobacteria bacterium]
MQSWGGTPPLIIERGEGCYLIDIEGRHYLDGVSSLWVTVHGHRCAEIDEAVRAQLGRMAHSTLLGLSHPPAIELAAELASLAPEGLTRVFYSDSGSTAVEVALKMAFQYWQLRGRPAKRHFIALREAYHGDTLGAVSVGGIELFHRIFHPLLFDVLRVAAPHAYRCAAEPSGHGPEACAAHCLAELAELLAARSPDLAALILEPRVQGAAGMLVHPPGYLAEVARLCRAHQVLLICDEVATGFGRTGPMFSCQAEDVRPDLLALAKGLTGGYLPLAATLATEEIYEAFLGEKERTFFHGHTYTGNPLACVAALASLQRMRDRQLLPWAEARAVTLSRLLAEQLASHPAVGQIRQLGLMVGVELVADRASRRPYPPALALGARVCQAARAHGVLLRPLGDVLVLMPPLAITDDQLGHLVSAARQALDAVLSGL